MQTVIVVAGIAFAVIRAIVVGLWCLLGDRAVSDSLVMELVITLLSDFIIVSIIGVTILHFAGRYRSDLTYETVSGSLTTYTLASLALLLLAAIIPHDVNEGRIGDFLTLISSNVIAIGAFAVTIALAGFLTSILLLRRHRLTKVYLFIQLAIILGIWLVSALSVTAQWLTVVSATLTFAGIVIMLLNIRRLNWLTTITLDRKVRLLWLTVCGAFASIVLSIMFGFGDETYVSATVNLFIRSGSAVPAVINLFGFVFFIRLLFAVIAALPNSGIVDRRSNEVDALATLTRLMTKSTDVSSLLASVTDHAMRVCHAHGAWCELYTETGVDVVATQLVHENYVRSLHHHRSIHRLITTADQPHLVESLSDEVAAVDPTVVMKSMIIVPLVNDHRRTGTLVVFSTVDFGFEQDDLKLLTAFGDTVSVALDQARLIEAAFEKERMQKEIDVARDIQASLLPRTAPTSTRVDVDAVTIPATDVGGDYYDYIKFASGTWGAIIADVAGKGVPAALYMATLKGVVLAEMRMATGPADLLRRINATLHGSMERHTYITMMCVEFHEDCRYLRIARAGHTPAVIRRGGVTDIVAPQGLAIGIVGSDIFDRTIEDVVLAVEPGDVCLLTTDGVTERRDPDLVEIEQERILELVQRVVSDSATDVVRATQHVLDDHGRGAEPHDDITIVAIVVRNETATADKRRSLTSEEPS